MQECKALVHCGFATLLSICWSLPAPLQQARTLNNPKSDTVRPNPVRHLVLVATELTGPWYMAHGRSIVQRRRLGKLRGAIKAERERRRETERDGERGRGTGTEREREGDG